MSQIRWIDNSFVIAPKCPKNNPFSGRRRNHHLPSFDPSSGMMMNHDSINSKENKMICSCTNKEIPCSRPLQKIRTWFAAMNQVLFLLVLALARNERRKKGHEGTKMRHGQKSRFSITFNHKTLVGSRCP